MSPTLPPWAPDLLALFAYGEDNDLMWSIKDDSEIQFSIVCSDTFAWGCADAEPITSAEDVTALTQAKTDLPDGDWPVLWCARKRGERPMPRWMTREDEPDRALFEAAGPPRESTWIAP